MGSLVRVSWPEDVSDDARFLYCTYFPVPKHSGSTILGYGVKISRGECFLTSRLLPPALSLNQVWSKTGRTQRTNCWTKTHVESECFGTGKYVQYERSTTSRFTYWFSYAPRVTVWGFQFGSIDHVFVVPIFGGTVSGYHARPST